jgi:PAS domain-containing protein
VQNAPILRSGIAGETRAELLINSAADGIIILTANHRIERYNHAFSNMFNINGQDLHGKHHEMSSSGPTLPTASPGKSRSRRWPLTPNLSYTLKEI